MAPKVSKIKWSNSFPGIISIVYAEYPTLVFLYDSSLLTTPGKFYEMDPNREHGSVQYFNDAIACMDWGYNKCENCLALGFANGDVIVRLCKGGIFKEEVYKKIHDSQSQSCICLSWRAVQNHVAVGYVKDENNYCIDIHDVSNHSLVIPTIACSRVIITLHWVERKSAKDRDRNAAPSRTQSKHYNYMVLGGSKERIEDTPDLLLVGYENYIQVMAIQSSSHQILYSVAMPYCRLATINSQLAVVCEYKSLSPSFIPDSATRQHVDIEYETPFLPPPKSPRGVSFDFRDASFMSKKKENDSSAAKAKEVGAPSFGKNAFVYDIDYSGKLEMKLSFLHTMSSILKLSWFSKQELFIADSRGYVIVNTWTGEVLRYVFPNHDSRVIQCAIDKLEHPIITRVIVYMENKSLFWDTIVPVLYRCMNFANNHLLCVSKDTTSFDWEDTRALVGDDVFDVVLKRSGQSYGRDVATTVQVCAEEFFASRTNTHTDLFFFWRAFLLLSQLEDEENAIPTVASMGSQLHTLRRVARESPWIQKGIIEVLGTCSTGNREEKCGRIRVYMQEKKERLVKKMLEAYNGFAEMREKMMDGQHGGNSPDFRHVLILVVQCKFEEAIMFINKVASSMTPEVRDPKATSEIDRLLVICNILTSISSKGDLKLIESNIMFQLNYYIKEVTPIMFKILHFLLMYIRYNADINYTRIREQNDHAIIEYLEVTNTGCFMAFEDLLVVLRYLSFATMMEYLKELGRKCVCEGYLVGLVLKGMGSSSIQQLLQHFVNRTSDVQTVSVLALYNYNVYKESELWIKNYLDLLSQASLFCERCALESRIYAQYGEIITNQDEHSERFIPGVIVCPNCNTKILPLNTNTSSWKAQSLKTPVCVTCQRELFTCSLCSLPVRQESSDWLVWCSSCHHGGHYAHITQWFASHDECPVNGCCCHCSEL
ncbi:hypothetical protein AV274_0403 [Blastocystis sp. ATCC 50177/Nand II]|uniref:GATOR2 complex protein MIO zinc-ribbon like domain-containing protein n=1 Tax=Blastocystis sp. subtype 1 (strain ATCC 50177 / NandII) TaxID=478820 RepID=A0A196SNS9_BLAHN|nr:hypothetical protein AV274_0403 [Blastocystis sp. ATCC 50177/Nand II]